MHVSLNGTERHDNLGMAVRAMLRDEIRDQMIEAARAYVPGGMVSPKMRADFAGVADMAVAVLFRRVRIVRSTATITPEDTSANETTQQLIDRLIKPQTAAAMADTLISQGLTDVVMGVPGAGEMKVPFSAATMVLDFQAKPRAPDSYGSLGFKGIETEVR